MYRMLLIGLITFLLLISTASSWVENGSCESDVYARLVPVGGIVTTKELETGEVTPVRGKTLLFQRLDCKRCIFAVKSGDEGIYDIVLNEGKYRIFVRECGPDRNQDCLAPEQREVISVKVAGDSQFDIKLVHSSADSIIKLPRVSEVPVEAVSRLSR